MTEWAPPGEYGVNPKVIGKKFVQKARITRTIGWSIGPRPEVIRWSILSRESGWREKNIRTALRDLLMETRSQGR